MGDCTVNVRITGVHTRNCHSALFSANQAAHCVITVELFSNSLIFATLRIRAISKPGTCVYVQVRTMGTLKCVSSAT